MGCPFRSYQKDPVLLHINRVHKKIREWFCPGCNHGFAVKSGLIIRMKKVHANNKEIMDTIPTLKPIRNDSQDGTSDSVEAPDTSIDTTQGPIQGPIKVGRG